MLEEMKSQTDYFINAREKMKEEERMQRIFEKQMSMKKEGDNKFLLED